MFKERKQEYEPEGSHPNPEKLLIWTGLFVSCLMLNFNKLKYDRLLLLTGSVLLIMLNRGNDFIIRFK